MRAWPIIASGTALAGGAVAAYVAWRQSSKTRAATVAAVASGGTIQINATGYWPFSATASEQQMEGGTTGAAIWNGHKVVDPVTGKRIQLHTVEEYLEGKVPYFSLSGDPEAWPFGQAVQVAWFDGKTILGRVVDTGSHFKGSQKVYRISGREPLDFCVASKSSKILSKTTGTIVKGDHFDKPGAEIVASAFKGQTVVAGNLEMLGT